MKKNYLTILLLFSIVCLKGQNSFCFSAAGSFTTGAYRYGPNISADFNNDGKMDLCFGTSSGFNIIISDGIGAYSAPIVHNFFPPAGGMVANDFNLDGIQDIICIGNWTNSVIFLGTGNGSLIQN